MLDGDAAQGACGGPGREGGEEEGEEEGKGERRMEDKEGRSELSTVDQPSTTPSTAPPIILSLAYPLRFHHKSYHPLLDHSGAPLTAHRLYVHALAPPPQCSSPAAINPAGRGRGLACSAQTGTRSRSHVHVHVPGALASCSESCHRVIHARPSTHPRRARAFCTPDPPTASSQTRSHTAVQQL